MNVEVLADADAVAVAAAQFIKQKATEAIAARGQFVCAVSGGTTPWEMLKTLSKQDLPWPRVHFVQVDERIAPDGDKDRNLTHFKTSLTVPAALHAMPVNAADPEAAAAEYQKLLEKLCGKPAVLDLVHLGLGTDGHTASLVPNDEVLTVEDRDVALTGIYQGRRRMTLTYPILNRARSILWLVTGATKAGPLEWLCEQDATIPAGRVNQSQATVLADRAAKAG